MTLPPNLKLVLDEAAREDYLGAVEWYRAYAGPDVADRFVEAIEAAFEQILHAPSRWPLVDNDIRRYVVRHFPYLIFYEIENGRIIIDAVAHAKRRPGYWKKQP